jgi:hypothetical protein
MNGHRRFLASEQLLGAADELAVQRVVGFLVEAVELQVDRGSVRDQPLRVALAPYGPW